jgi:hypothetical protein
MCVAYHGRLANITVGVALGAAMDNMAFIAVGVVISVARETKLR